MSLSIIGRIERVELGTGCWSLTAETGETYEIMNMPEELVGVKNKVKVIGKIRDDAMTLAMIGSVLEVESFEVVEN
jgi:hypothetical protein